MNNLNVGNNMNMIKRT